MAHEIDRKTRLIDLTVGELMDVIQEAKKIMVSEPKEAPEPKDEYKYGIAGIASLFNCSISTANRIKAQGRIDAAISQRGRTMVINCKKALELFDAKREQRKAERENEHSSIR